MANTVSIGTGVVFIPFTKFVPLIDEVANILSKVANLYHSAQHNKKITKILLDRITAANIAVSVLHDDDLYTSAHHANLQKLVRVLQNMRIYSEDITQYNTLRRFL